MVHLPQQQEPADVDGEARVDAYASNVQQRSNS